MNFRMTIVALGAKTALGRVRSVRARSVRARAVLRCAVVAVAAISACAVDTRQERPDDLVAAGLTEPAAPVAGTYPVGTVRVELAVNETRRVPVQLWYPAEEGARAEAATGHSMAEFEPVGLYRWTLRRLMREAPEAYVQRTMHAADAPAVAPRTAPFPLVLFSHCADCLRFSSFSVAERLASQGFVVAAPDHVGGTYYDQLAGTSTIDMIGFLDQRLEDIEVLLDTMIDPQAMVVPNDMRGRIDAQRIGMVGHSLGGLTTAYAAIEDPRIRAISLLAMAVPPADDPLFGPLLSDKVAIAELSQPALFIMAEEDLLNLVGLNDFIRYDFDHYPTQAWLATLNDAGHFSVSDLCGLDDYFMQGCGDGLRMTEFLTPFTHVDNAIAMQQTSALVAAFIAQELLGADPAVLAEVAEQASDVLELEHREP